MFDKLKKSDEVQTTGDKIFGGKPDSGVYDCTIDMAYYDTTQAGAGFVALSVITETGFTFSKNLYIISNNEKGNLPYYTDKNGKKKYLKGYEIMSDIYELVLERGLETIDEDVEDKLVNVYDYESKENVPTEKAVIVPLIGQQVKLALQVQQENEKDREKGYADIPGTSREIIEIDRVFDIETGQSPMEKQAGAEANFMDTWLTRFEGKVIDRRKYKDDAEDIPMSSGSETKPAPSKKKLFA